MQKMRQKMNSQISLKSPQKRDYSLDIARGIGIFLIVFGHSVSNKSNPVTSYTISLIYSFHVPLFFFISGMLSSKKEFKNLKSIACEIKKKLYSLIIPYFIWNTVFLSYATLTRFIGNMEDLSTLIKNSVVSLFSFGGSPLWFLPALFFAFLYLYATSFNKFVSFGIMMLLLPVCYFFETNNVFIESLLRWIPGGFFLVSGYLFGKFFKKILPVPFIITLFVSLFGLVLLNPSVDMSTRMFGNPFLYLMNAFIGIYLILFVSRKLEPIGSNIFIKQIAFFGKNSIIILCTHMLIINIIRLIDYKFFANFLSNIGILEGILLSLLTFFILRLIIPVLSKFLWWSFGKKNPNSK